MLHTPMEGQKATNIPTKLNTALQLGSVFLGNCCPFAMLKKCQRTVNVIELIQQRVITGACAFLC